MRYISLFSGIEAATVAWHPLGWQAAAFAEVDPFCCAVLKHYYPAVPNLGDVTKISQAQIEDLGPVDVVVFGSPCQDLSVAGKRAGLKGARSGLFFTAMGIVRWAGARFALWENVPGAFSSNGGGDFAAVVGEMAGVEFDVPDGGWENSGVALGPDGLVEWCVLDAQFFGVPQRRRRVFALRDSGDWASRPPLLLERHSLSGYPPPRREAGKGTACGIEIGPQGGGFTDINPTLDARCKDGPIRNQLAGAVAMCLNVKGGMGRIDGETCGPLMANTHPGAYSGQDAYSGMLIPAGRIDGESETFVPVVAPTLSKESFSPTKSSSGQMVDFCIAHSLRADGFDAPEDGTGRGTPLVPVAFAPRETAATIGERMRGQDDSCADNLLPVAFDTTQVTSKANYSNPKPGDPCHPLAAGAHAPAVVLPDTLQYNGISHASTQETYAREILRSLRQEVGEETFAEWGFGVLGSLQSPEVLRPEVLRQSDGAETQAHQSRLDGIASESAETLPSWAVRAMRQSQSLRCSPQGRGLAEQRSRELGAHLSQLPHERARRSALLQGLWQASEGLGPLRQALSALQEIRRPTDHQGQPAHSTYAVRRLTPREAERLQGFPDDYTLIPYRGKPAADGPRYKALGNSMAVPVMAWIGRRIQEAANV